MKKNIYSLHILAQLLKESNRRYLEFISTFDDPSDGIKFIPDFSPSSITRILKRLLLHGLIKKVANSRKYYLTKLGKVVIATGLKTRALFIIPSLVSLEVAAI